MNKNNLLKIVFFGTPDFAVKILETMKANNLTPTLIITAPDKQSGRGLKLTPPAVKVWAIENGVAFLQPPTLRDENLTLQIDTLHPDIFVVASYGKIIPTALLAVPTKGALNVHPSLLPKYRGASPIHGAILAGERRTGATIILLDAEMDHGPILAQQELDENIDQMNFVELEGKLAELGGALLVKTIFQLVGGEIISCEQDHTSATYTKKITKEDGHINWQDSAQIIKRRVLALNPWPGTFTFWRRGGKLTRLIMIHGQVVADEGHNFAPGTVFEWGDKMAVRTGEGSFIVENIKPEGKKETTSQELLRGSKDILGAILE
jgi:methionyl-tRNA formyltransferase